MINYGDSIALELSKLLQDSNVRSSVSLVIDKFELSGRTFTADIDRVERNGKRSFIGKDDGAIMLAAADKDFRCRIPCCKNCQTARGSMYLGNIVSTGMITVESIGYCRIGVRIQ